MIAFVRKVADRHLALEMGDSNYMGLSDKSEAVMRMTVAVTPGNLIKRLLRLRELSELMDKIGPINSLHVPDADHPFAGPAEPGQAKIEAIGRLQS